MRKKERREFIRVAVYHLAKYKTSADAGGSDLPELAYIRDIGGGGVCLRTDKPVALSSLLQLKINFPLMRVPVFALAKAVWVKQIKKDKVYDVGLQFIEIDDSVRGLIKDKLDLLHKQVQHRKNV